MLLNNTYDRICLIFLQILSIFLCFYYFYGMFRIQKMKELRAAILRMRSFGDSMGKIAKDLRISKATVQTAIERGTIEDRPGRGRKKTARSQQNIRRAKAMIQRNPTTKANSSRKLVKKLGISHVQAWQILREDLGLKPWKACVDANGGWFE